MNPAPCPRIHEDHDRALWKPLHEQALVEPRLRGPTRQLHDGPANKAVPGSSLRWNADIHGSIDRKSTRLNSSHWLISYAVFCLKKKKKKVRSEEHTSELQSLAYLVCRLLLEKKKKQQL